MSKASMKAYIIAAVVLIALGATIAFGILSHKKPQTDNKSAEVKVVEPQGSATSQKSTATGGETDNKDGASTNTGEADSPIVGTWVQKDNKDLTVSFTKDGKVVVGLQGKTYNGDWRVTSAGPIATVKGWPQMNESVEVTLGMTDNNTVVAMFTDDSNQVSFERQK